MVSHFRCGRGSSLISSRAGTLAYRKNIYCGDGFTFVVQTKSFLGISVEGHD